ncbi:MAG: hypothetical protein ACREV6_13385 [Clostridium sp.]
MVTPAEGFHATKGLGINEIRLSYCLNTTALKEAMEILGIALEKYMELNR